MALPKIYGQVFFAPMLIFPIALSMLRFRSLKETQMVMGVILLLWLGLMWFGKGVFYHVVNFSTNMKEPYFEYPTPYDLNPPNVGVMKLLPKLEIDLAKYDWIAILILLIIARYIYGIIFF